MYSLSSFLFILCIFSQTGFSCFASSQIIFAFLVILAIL